MEQKNKLPEQWAWTTLGELGVVVSGSTPSTKEPLFWGGDIAWVTPADLSDIKEKYIKSGKRNITQLGLNYSSTVLLPKNSLLFRQEHLLDMLLYPKANCLQTKDLKI